MEIVRGLHNLRAAHRGCAVTIGNFDGVHVGHQAMLEHARNHGQRLGVPATVLTFEPTPREFLDPQNAPPRLTRLREKLTLLARYGADRSVVLRFEGKLQRIRAEPFAEELLAGRLGARVVVVGHDFKFGYRGEADVKVLERSGSTLGFEVDVIAPVMREGERVSSSLIREALGARDLDSAARWLGRRYSMQGRVIRGQQLGRKLGFPTANMRVHRRKTPITGIFAVRVFGVDGQPLPAVASLGSRPTVGGREILLEAHLFDFDGDLYGRHLEVEFVGYLREERKFATLEAMVVQMHVDAKQARAVLEATA